MRKFLLTLPIAVLITGVTAVNADAQAFRTIKAEVLKDKIAGGWAGKMIGVTYGAPTEFRFQQSINTDPVTWSTGETRGSLWQDDLYVQLTFLMAMDEYGVNAPAVKFQEMLAKAGYPLWCANMQARKNFFDGIYPPASGNPEHNFRADDIDFQIEADYIGFMNPGMPANVVKTGGTIGHIMNYGDGVYGGIFLGAMYAAAFFENGIQQVIRKGLEAIPGQSDYARIIRDVILLHEHYPGDWQSAWKELDAKWGDVDISGAGSPFNIDAKLNGAYIVMGLLYGEGDIMKTMEITTRCGQDSDCNPSSAMAVLGVMRGFSGLPADMQEGILQVGDSLFIHTNYTFNKAVESTFMYAVQQVAEYGGDFRGGLLTIPTRQTIPPELEVSFPDAVFEKSIPASDKLNWKYLGNWKPEDPENPGQCIYSGTPGNTAEITFEGTGISLAGNWVKEGGMADIYLDGNFMKSIDTYYNYSNQEHTDVSIWHKFGLDHGKHTLRVVVTGKKNMLSAENNIYLTRAVIYKSGSKKSDNHRFSFEKQPKDK